MKAFGLLLCAGAFAAMCVSCSGKYEWVPHSYNLMMSFVDAEGNDLVAGLEGIEPEGSIEADFVKPELYTLRTSPSLYDLGAFHNTPLFGFTPVEPQDPDTQPELELCHPPTGDISENWLVAIHMASVPWYEGDNVKKITYTLTCPHIFGDDAAHDIVAYWRDPSSGPSYYSVCYKVEVGGKEFTDIVYDRYGRNVLATIVLDR